MKIKFSSREHRRIANLLITRDTGRHFYIAGIIGYYSIVRVALQTKPGIPYCYGPYQKTLLLCSQKKS